MRFRQLGEFVQYLESRGELRRVSVRVAPEGELAEVVARLGRRGGPAVLFERVDEAPYPVVANLFGSARRVAWGMGVERLDELTARVGKLLGVTQGGVPERLGDKLRLLGQLRDLAGLGPRSVRQPPCQAVVNTAAPTFADLPPLRCWPADAGPSLPLVAVHAEDLDTGERLAMPARAHLLDATTAALHWPAHGRGAAWQRRLAERGGRATAALVLGGDPATAIAGLVSGVGGLDPFVFAGWLREAPVSVARCRTCPLEVPAEAELVLEGVVEAGVGRRSGPFGERGGEYEPADDRPLFRLTGLTRREQPIIPVVVPARPPNEATYLDLAVERLLLPFVRLAAPEVVDYHAPAAGALRSLVVVAIRNSYPGAARQVLHALWGLNLFALSKAIVVVDADVDVRDEAAVLWTVTRRVDPARDLILSEGPLDPRDRSTAEPGYGGKLGLDATRRPGQRGDGPTPAAMVAATDTARLVDRRWAEYGLP